MRVADVLREARRLIETRGWTQREFQDGDGCLCAVGAINMAAYGQPVCIRRSAAEVLLADLLPRDVVSWNDDSSTTVVEVLMTFDQAVAEAEARS